ncbi:uncharacterized protein LOC117648490 [Thrips palmi]|uniref:Gustatory receptor n=1 Tax=Thrips palmi TaxID=161013 RepID=A0A6P8ZCX6_THRPL|nr:uncharacterized protein LOC117648490 [Thrips palmi]
MADRRGDELAGGYWTKLWTLQWRAVLLLLRLGGRNCSSGWPPTASAWWTRYAVVVLLLSIVVGIVNVGRNILAPRTVSETATYLVLLNTADIVVKQLATVASQVMTIVRRSEIALLVQDVASYLSAYPATLPSLRGMNAILGVYVLSTFLPGIFSQAVNYEVLALALDSEGVFTQSMLSMAVLQDTLEHVLPSLYLALLECAFVGVLVAGVFLAADVADDVQDLVAKLSSTTWGSLAWDGVTLGSVEDKRVALQLRELRARQQRLHDVVVATNSAQGGVILCSLLVTVMEACVCVYTGASLLTKFDFEDESQGLVSVVWGVNLILRFIVNCILGQRLCNNHTRISVTLQEFLADSPILPIRTKQEVQGFLHQVQMLDNRCGVYDLLYFDLTTMSTVIASFATFLVMLFQFDKKKAI